MNMSMCEVPVHPVQFLSVAELESLPELLMTQAEDGTYYCNGESTQDGTPSPDNPVPILNTYPAGTYKAICGDKTYKITLDDDLRSVPGVADRVRIDAGRGLCWVERKVNVVEFDGSEYYRNTYYPTITTSSLLQIKGNIQIPPMTNYSKVLYFGYSNKTGRDVQFSNCDTYWNFADVDECKAWLKEKYDSGNPMYFYYVLADPTTHQSVPTQLTTISSGRSLTIPNTVNDAVDFLTVKGDSWQLVQEEITDEEGNVTQPAMPSPEYPSEIVSVEGEMRESGWNLVDSDILRNPNVFDKTWNNYGFWSYGLHLKPNTKYVISRKNTDGYGSGAYIKVNTENEYRGIGIWFVSSHSERENKKQLNIKTTETGEIWLLFGSSYAKVEKALDICGILQISEIESKKLDRHRGNSITLPALRGLPDGTHDTLYVDRRNKRAWVERCVGEAVFDGSEDEVWYKWGRGYGIYTPDAVHTSDIRIANAICNRYNAKPYNSIMRGEFGFGIGVYNNTSICEFFSDKDTLDDWKSWLSSNPLTVLYELATPTIEELPYSDYLLETCQYETTLQISCNEHLEPEIEVECKVLGR